MNTAQSLVHRNKGSRVQSNPQVGNCDTIQCVGYRGEKEHSSKKGHYVKIPGR